MTPFRKLRYNGPTYQTQIIPINDGMNDPSENMTSYCKTTLHISLGEGNDMSWTCKEMTGVTRQHDTKQTRKRSRRIGSTCEGY